MPPAGRGAASRCAGGAPRGTSALPLPPLELFVYGASQEAPLRYAPLLRLGLTRQGRLGP
jgi:hypothetical protein